MSEASAREKLIRWEDPMVTAAKLRTMSGLEALQALERGEVALPPIIKLLGFRMKLVQAGKVQFSSVPDESHYNLLGSVHGGAIATLLDTVMGCAVQSVLPLGRTYTTLNIGVNYIRALSVATGEVVAEGTIVHAGRSTALAKGHIVDAAGKLIATGETTCLVFDVP
ncbi:MAG: PaaI family thioesterase [Gemmatimonadota bacterium]|nr:PaaI family thioesterase [Gemmatimonadota bacterium]